MLDAMAAAGLSPAKSIAPIADGQLHRYRVEGDRAGSQNGWYVLHAGRVPAGAFGSWKTGQTCTWRAETDTPLTRAERAELRRQHEDAQRRRAAEQKRVHQETAARATGLWFRARPATDSHPYLRAKRVRAVGLRQLRDALLVPLRDERGKLWSLQFIQPDGGKRFLSGGRTRGCYFAIGRPQDCLVIAEGYATAATVFEATGAATAVAFNAGNLLPVARLLRRKFPRLRIIIAADDDHATPGNPGMAAAHAAADAVGGEVVAPRFVEVAP